jgi:AraC-like DNA-binding protein
MQIVDFRINPDQHEATQHGTAAFPLAIYETVLSKNVLGFINWHWHEELQFCYVTRGAVSFHVNEREYLLYPRSGIFVNSGYLHMAKPAGGADSTYLCLDVSPRLLGSFAGSVFERRYVEPYVRNPALAELLLSPDVPWQEEVMRCMPQINTLCGQGGFGFEFDVVTLLGRMWVTLLRNYQEQDEKTFGSHLKKNTVAQAIITYLQQHYTEPVTLEDLAREVSFSGSECCRLFKKVTGETIFAYLQTYRLTQSVDLLCHSDLPVSQIAYEAGFCSTSYFIKTFKGRFGITPKQYLKNLAQEGK